jgi:hypothetical protein
MTGFEAVVADIEASAKGMSSAAETIGSADPSSELSGIQAALEGGTSPAAATSLSTAWTKRFSAWSAAARQHATARTTSAASYTQADHEAAQRLMSEAAVNRGPAMAQDR